MSFDQRIPSTIRTLIVEDEPVAAHAHQAYVNRVAGFEVRGISLTGADAMATFNRSRIDLVLLDIKLPDSNGLELFSQIRAVGATIDVIVVSSARDVETVRAAVAQGAVSYIIKPFPFSLLRQKLLSYQLFRDQLGNTSEFDQDELDRALSDMRPAIRPPAPKGFTQETLDLITDALRKVEDSSAGEVAVALGLSRITTRRYLGQLVDSGVARRTYRYGPVGRPEARYQLIER